MDTLTKCWMISILLFCLSCKGDQKSSVNACAYLDNSTAEDLLTGGIKMVPIQTPKGEYKVWTKRVGNNPKHKLLLLHGGPGATHEYFECFDSYLPYEGIEYYYYDQLESAYSDQPNDPELWTIERYVDEVEQVRKALGLHKDNFILLGHSWGGILAIEYALKHQQHLKGLIISNMMASIPAYQKYANEVLAPKLDPEVLRRIKQLESEGKYTDKRYVKLVTEHYYPKHVLRMPIDEWPDPVNRAFDHLAYNLYLAMQGPSEFGIIGDAILKHWDREADLKKIKVPTLTIGATYDTMDPKHMERMAKTLPKGQYLHCPEGSHMAMYDDQKKYINGVVKFIKAL